MEQHPIKINKVQIRNLQIEDYVQLSQSFTRVYSERTTIRMHRLRVRKYSIHIALKEISCMALKYSSTRAIVVCVSHVVCMNIVRSFAKH